MIEGKSNIPMQLGVYAQTLFAVSTMVWSLARSSLREIAFPAMELAKPHCGGRASRSSGKKALASRMRLDSSDHSS